MWRWNRLLTMENLNMEHLINRGLVIKRTSDMIRFQLSEEAIDFLKKDFGHRSNKKPLDRNFKINYLVDYGNQFFLNEYFKFYVIGELRSKEFRACVIDTPKYNNLAIISKR